MSGTHRILVMPDRGEVAQVSASSRQAALEAFQREHRIVGRIKRNVRICGDRMPVLDGDRLCYIAERSFS